MSEQLCYLMASFDLHLGEGLPPGDAWQEALEDYVYVYHTDEGTHISRAAERALIVIRADSKTGADEH